MIVTEVVNVFSASFDSFGLNFEEGGYIFEGNFSVFPKLKTYRTFLLQKVDLLDRVRLQISNLKMAWILMDTNFL